MADKKISSVNLLPEYLKTDKNKKFLSSTLDQLIQKPELERLNGYVGSTKTPTYKSDDSYVLNPNPYQLDPALVTYDNLKNVQSIQGYDDLINEIAAKGGLTNNLDRLFRSKVYSYDAHIDWDKLVNYQNYYWMPYGPETLGVPVENAGFETEIEGQVHATVNVLKPDGTLEPVELSNGMMLAFYGDSIIEEWYDREFWVEGVGTSIKLIPADTLLVSEKFISAYPDGFDSQSFDLLPFDNDRELPNIRAEYVTINRASADLNPWSRYNRWVHKDVVRLSASLNGLIPDFSKGRAQRPIIEFRPDIQLFNFGSVGIDPVDILDNNTTDPFTVINGTTSYSVDGVELEEGHRIIFNAAQEEGIKGKIYEVRFLMIQGVRTLTLQPSYDYEPPLLGALTILAGNTYNSTDWWYNGSDWVYAQQRDTLNQSPLFDLYDLHGRSFGDREYYLSNFPGTKIFSYSIGTGIVDEHLGFPIAYRHIDAIGGILFENNLVTDEIVVSQIGTDPYIISSSIAYCKVKGEYKNAWVESVEYPIPVVTSTTTGILSYYEEPLSLTNNPLNGFIKQFTISEISEHVQSMTDRIPNFDGNLRDASDYTNLGLKLISNGNPIAFAQMFIGKKEHNLISALEKSAENYGTFKLSFINSLLQITEAVDPDIAVDQILLELNQNKTEKDLYYYSDMVGYGTAENIKTWTVTNANNVSYPLVSDFDLNSLSTRAVYVYVNGTHLIKDRDYIFNTDTTSVDILIPLVPGDLITIKDFADSTGCYVPPTPSKLGLYPAFVPEIFVDDTYATPQTVIQGHDGSITIAYGDYRDEIILELEKRIYNNIKVKFNKDLLDVFSVVPGAFRTTEYSRKEITDIISGDFIKWAAKFSIDYVSNTTYDSAKSLTWNLYNRSLLSETLSGTYRTTLKYFYDTDRPHTHPWEMLGLYNKPDWWEATYGPAPYTSGNLVLWQDLADGKINGEVNSLYARPDLLDIIPVDEDGNLVAPDILTQAINSVNPIDLENDKRRGWSIGDMSPAETAWTRSSYYPFAVQRLLALTKPATYAALMYDLSRVTKNILGQWTYGQSEEFLKLSKLAINGENGTLTAGYSVFLADIGQDRDKTYIAQLRQDLEYVDYNLIYKLGGFADKDALQIIVDAYEPTSNSPGSVLPSQNFDLKLNVSNPIYSASASGIIVQRVAGGFSVRGYDTHQPYFTIFKSIRNLGTASITVGGVTEKYVKWEGSETASVSQSSGTASVAPTGQFYQKGQYVQYGSAFYVVKVAHRSSGSFNTEYFQKIPELPTRGGATVQLASSFERHTTIVPYGTIYESIQEVYDLIIGYGRWLESQGFKFDGFNTDLNSTLDWNLSAKEFLFWSTQAWATGSVITLSAFADSLVYSSPDSVVNNLLDPFYDYSILTADFSAFPITNLNISRIDDVCTIATIPNSEGIYFVRLNLVQKEHVVVFDNTTIFGDVIYDIETGSRQRRVKLVGFKTANWNGDYTSPGFVYDTAEVSDWTPNKFYIAGSVVRFSGKYYAAIKNVDRAATFNFNLWNLLDKKPSPGLLPNFDYKISQFEDFYSLDAENFDAGQERMAQHLTGYTPRVYLNNVFPDPVAQYKFYQGYIREKGTKNAVTKLAKASLSTLKGTVEYKEEWAFRVGHYGAYTTFNEIEVPLVEGTFLENPQILNFVSTVPPKSAKDLIHYVKPSDLTISPDNFDPDNVFKTTASEDAMILQHAGYVRLKDVTATAYNETSLLDIANAGQLKDGDVIWLGFKQDGSWDIYRYTYVPAEVIGVYVSAPLSSITFTTQYPHGLSTGQLIGINNFNSQVDGIYKIIETPSLRQFTVASELANIENAPLLSPGNLYVFASNRIGNFDALPADQVLYRLPAGTKYWIDSDTTGWAVYEKVNNFSNSKYLALSNNSQLGAAVSKRKGNSVIVVGTPNTLRSNTIGSVWFYDKIGTDDLKPVIKYIFAGTYPGQPTGLGSSVVYDDLPFNGSKYGIVFAGAPLAYSSQGVVQINAIDSRIMASTVSFIANPSGGTVTKFGSTLFVQRNTLDKRILVGGDTAVYSYDVSTQNNTITVSAATPLLTGVSVKSISGSEDASVLAIGLTGYVDVYNRSLSRIDRIAGEDSSFGQSVYVTPSGSKLFVSAPALANEDGSLGKVFVYENVNNLFALVQTIINPVMSEGMNFGICIDSDVSGNNLVITSTGINHTLPTTFDGGLLTLDGGVTKIKGTETGTGAAYLYTKKNTRYVFSQELADQYIYDNIGNNFGYSLAVDDTSVVVGAPSFDNVSIKSGIIKFDKKDLSVNGWKVATREDDFVDLSSLRRVALVDTYKDEVLNYLDLYDPVKGKIPGIAEQELTYKLVSDPAIYSVGIDGTNNDANKNWLDNHVGELWWDLSTAKYVWYEQGDLEYRKNNWGKLFPGATIDVYEWVSSTLLPSEWAIQADTTAGIASGISGQPRFPDNSVLSAKQVYNPVTNSFTNVYYYWVKNKTIIPTRKDRRLSAYSVAAAIADPTAYGLEFAAIIDKNALMLSNIGTRPIGSRISINIAQDLNTAFVNSPKHTQWLLMQEGNAEHVPPISLEKKMVDSLLGHDSIGNLVPDPNLSDRVKYGVEVRPRQSMFKNRYEALRNVIVFSNTVLAKVPVTGNYSFLNLNAQEEIPNKTKNLYDYRVEDNSTLEIIPTEGFERAILDCTVGNNGAVVSVSIVNPGYGYGTLNPVIDLAGNIAGYQGPVFTDINHTTIFDSGLTTFDGGNTLFKDSNINTFAQDLIIETLVNEQGQIINAVVVNGGRGYSSSFKYLARPHTVFVESDDTYNGKWTRFEWDYTNNEWFRAHTQSYNTTLYWDYVDWVSEDYDLYQIYTSVVGSPYELGEISLTPGQYVKVNNGGDGNHIILKRLANDVRGTYGIGYDIVYKQNGTIKLSDSLWDRRSSSFNWDNVNTFDQTLWDQTPDIEIEYIIRALKHDLFINELKVNWNLLFFAVVRYTLTEQKLLDWAFKTSFINVVNEAGSLEQPPVYKLQDSEFYENYIEEIKPYHTKIRDFTTVYSIVDPTNTEIVENDRTTTVELKFDRTTSAGETGEFVAFDTFLANGIDEEFILNWIPKPDRSRIIVKVNGVLSLSSEFTVQYYSNDYNGYSKKYAKLVFYTAPEEGSVITTAYEKDPASLNAVDRILSYYTSTNGLVSLDLGQLMTGIDYPGTILDGIGFADPRALMLDSMVSGGTWANGNLVSALGINPEDLTVDGQFGFLTPESGYAPEEVLPGFVTDSLGLNVYTRRESGPAVVYSYQSAFLASVDVLEFDLIRIPPTVDSLAVIVNGYEYHYTEASLTVGDKLYTIDWANSKLLIPPQIDGGQIGYTILSVGGGSGEINHFGILDKEFYNAGTATNATFETVCNFDLIEDAFVTVNGLAIEAVTTTTDYGYMLTENLGGNCVVNVYNMPPTDQNAIQVWLFDEPHYYFNEVRQQIFEIPGMATTTPLSLNYPPGVKGPLSAQTVVEITDTDGTRVLLPPNTNYFKADPSNIYTLRVVQGLDLYTLTAPDIVVWKNGVIEPNFVYNGDLTVSLVTPATGNDEIAVEVFLPEITTPTSTYTDYNYDYRIDGTSLYLSAGAQQPNYPYITNATVKVITYTNHDGLQMYTEQFRGDINRRFEMARQVIDDRYVWVNLFKYVSDNDPPITRQLINGYDFIVLEDNQTVELSDSWVLDDRDIVEIISFLSPPEYVDVIGYRIFNDMLGNTSFTRLNHNATSVLTQPLSYTDTEIYVKDATVFTPPNEEDNIPGVVYINGERIEFRGITTNSLVQITRGTLGTGPAAFVPAGTRVVDLGVNQHIDSMEHVRIQNTFTNTLTNIYYISTVSENIYMPGTDDLVQYDGIKLSTNWMEVPDARITGNLLSDEVNLADQLDIYYGGRLLRKSGIYVHDNTVSYDSISLDQIKGNVASKDQLPTGVNVGDAYLITGTNKVYVYTGSRTESTATYGYVYSGLTYYPEEFKVEAGTQQVLTLNTTTIALENDIQLTIVKKDYQASAEWNDKISQFETRSLIESTSSVALFLKAGPAELPTPPFNMA